MEPFRPLPAGAVIAVAIGVANLCLPAGANARPQDMPHVDAVGAYNHANVMTGPRTTRKDGIGRPHEAETAAESAVVGDDTSGTISRAGFDALVSGLRIEYHERVGRDGQASADAWLERSVEALKRRYTTVED